MPKYLKAVAMKTEKSTAEHTLMWLILPKYINCHRERSGRVLDSRPRGRGFEPHRRHCVVVLEQDTFILA